LGHSGPSIGAARRAAARVGTAVHPAVVTVGVRTARPAAVGTALRPAVDTAVRPAFDAALRPAVRAARAGAADRTASTRSAPCRRARSAHVHTTASEPDARTRRRARRAVDESRIGTAIRAAVGRADAAALGAADSATVGPADGPAPRAARAGWAHRTADGPAVHATDAALGATDAALCAADGSAHDHDRWAGTS
jgi:hypothetical protein